MKEIGVALLKHDVNIKVITQLKNSIKADVKKESNPNVNQAKLIQKCVFNSLVKMLSPDRDAYKPKKGYQNVIMFVGLQGSGKTTTCTKLAHYLRRKNFKTALVCADTFRAGAFDQLKQNAAKAKIPFYGSDVESDPVRIAEDGVREFKRAGYDVIIVDTSGRHMQEASLFEEMRQVASAVKPDEVIYVMDSHIGQKSEDQAKAFASSADVGSVILTKLDGHAKGGGALSAVVATGAPISYIGTGEHFDDLEVFDPHSFVSKLLGIVDVKGLISSFQDVVSTEQQKNLMENLQKGKFTFRMMSEQMRSVLKMGPMSSLMSMAGLNKDMVGELNSDESQKKMRAMVSSFDSMTAAELDGDMELINDSRLKRIARGCGIKPTEFKMLIEQQKQMSKMFTSVGKLSAAASGQGGKPKLNNSTMQQVSQMQNMMKNSGIDPQKLQRDMRSGNTKSMNDAMAKMQHMMGGDGAGGLGNLLGGNSGLGEMMNSMLGGGAAGGLNPLAAMMGGGGGLEGLSGGLGGGMMQQMMQQMAKGKAIGGGKRR